MSEEEKEKTELVSPWVLRLTVGMLGLLVLTIVFFALVRALEVQRYQLISNEPLIIEDSFSHTLYTNLDVAVTLRRMETWPINGSVRLITGDRDIIELIKADADENTDLLPD